MNTIFQFIPLTVSVIGAALVVFFSPLNPTMISGGTFTEDSKQIKAHIRRKNHLLRFGLFLVVAGAVGQLVVFAATKC